MLATTSPDVMAQAVADDFAVKLERTACYGECPYSVIDAGGNVTRRKKFVESKGGRRIAFRRPAPPGCCDRRAHCFFELRDRYRTIRNPDGTETMVTDANDLVTITRGESSESRIQYRCARAKGTRAGNRRDRANDVDGFDWTFRHCSNSFGTWSPSVEERAELLRKALQSMTRLPW